MCDSNVTMDTVEQCPKRRQSTGTTILIVNVFITGSYFTLRAFLFVHKGPNCILLVPVVNSLVKFSKKREADRTPGTEKEAL